MKQYKFSLISVTISLILSFLSCAPGIKIGDFSTIDKDKKPLAITPALLLVSAEYSLTAEKSEYIYKAELLKLKNLGFSTLEYSNFKNEFDSLSSSQKWNLIDQYGFVDNANLSIFAGEISKVIQKKHAIGGVAIPILTLSRASVQLNIIRWDGIQEPIQTAEDGVKGSSVGLSFMAAIFNNEGKPLLINKGGIQNLLEPNTNLQLSWIPQDKFLKDDKKIANSIDIAFRPLEQVRIKSK